MTADYKKKFFTEAKRQLARAEIQTGDLEGNSFPVLLDGKPVCHVVPGWEGVLVSSDDYGTPQVRDLTHKVKQIALTVREYVSAMEAAPLLMDKYKGLDDKWKLLTGYNNVVLTGMAHQYGYQFAALAVDRDGHLRDGDYYTDFGCEYDDHYGNAKEAFALRAGLVDENKLFSAEQLANLKTILDECREIGEQASFDALEDLAEKIGSLLPAGNGETQGQGLSL